MSEEQEPVDLPDDVLDVIDERLYAERAQRIRDESYEEVTQKQVEVGTFSAYERVLSEATTRQWEANADGELKEVPVASPVIVDDEA